MVSRKVIQHGKSSLSATLPNKWTKKNKIKKGQEIDMIDKGRYLIIDSKERDKELSKNVKFSDKIPKSMVMHYTAALYRVGYDKLIFKYDIAKTYKAIAEVTGCDLNGFDIIENKNNTCTIHSPSKIEENEFNKIFESLLHNVFEIANSSFNAIKNDDDDEIENAQTQENIINRNANYCERKLIKEGHVSPEEIPFLFYIIKELENIGDEYSDICNHYSNKLSSKTLEVYNEVNDCLGELKKLILKEIIKKSLKLEDGAKLYQDLGNKIGKVDNLLDANNKDDCILHHLSNVLRRTKSCLGCLFSIMIVEEQYELEPDC
jgi:phosphate uptake regulator